MDVEIRWGVFPAWAGMNRIRDSPPYVAPCVPRVGGDEPAKDARKKRCRDVFPAWAGMNRYKEHVGGTFARVPRVGGDEPEFFEPVSPAVQCSPRGRG